MNITFSLLPSEHLQKKIQSEFPGVSFHFSKGIDHAKEAFMDSEVFVTFGEDLTPEWIINAPKLKWIMVMSAGLEKMPFKECRERGILVTNVKGIHKIPMAEFTIGTMLQHVKSMRQLWENEAIDLWDRKVPMGELHGKTVLILGAGAIGGEIARLAKAFGMNTFGVNRSGRPAEYMDKIFTVNHFHDSIPEADFLVSVLPSTKETQYLLTGREIGLMKKEAAFINIGRGDVINEDVLHDALKNGTISHAYLDVFEEEPLPKGHAFWMMENVTVTPHLSGITKKYLPRAFEIFERNLNKYVNKETDFENTVNLERGY
ncbi:D-2-hydroxyacid dehydrogenase [Mesobacillus zeae]|uniref:D-2-hydroxyacid dehydrogenase n=1 Tax=Mesobacillus zeae TaxID=1917180 RepID=A0A398B9I4_9BACI|nr:D-2-hydroxyacid dehydrogenase [Mesobacillus zeae]